ncbi:class I SAM-dependent methyltransferase [Flagellimonas meridianipacifica]|uniref:Methyltransferase family protein n=1 Tax=Flagellimonas meridianipacifica TaxID=1080225 RepID=A0A2T0M8G4_9FLAO|nr:class I SAM-dependent methyltransferase [Allomuricauda pacifica]PRX53763.1 methyltransferase family protein [Allomuricauda pacifica]
MEVLFNKDILGNALLDYHDGRYSEDIVTLSSLDEQDVIPLPYLFRTFEQMPKIEQRALELAFGKVLDVGCGAGSHSLYLQEKGHTVTGLDSSYGAIEVCKLRGLKSVVHSEIQNYNDKQFDTLLLLMNGIGLAGKLSCLEGFLKHLKELLKPDGQILLDSSDIIYMFEQDEDGGIWIPGDTVYYGEVTFSMEYKGQRGEAFDWLYLDFNSLKECCNSIDLKCELVISGEHYDYLAKLSLK